MTNEEHRKIVDAVIDAHKDNEMGGKYSKAFNHGVQSAFNRVCKALEDIEKPCEDCISREQALDCFEQTNTRQGAKYAIETLPSVTPKGVTVTDFADKCRECGKIQNELSEDCISRKQALDDKGLAVFHRYDDYVKMRNYLKSLPSVKPKYTDEEIDKAQAVEQAYVDKMVELAVEEVKRPKGKWIKCKSRFGVEYFKCSECGRRLDWIDRDDNYCNNCGSDNSESTKEWFKEWDTKLAKMSGGGEDETSD